MLKLAAYADKLSVRPGETIRFHVSNATGAEVATHLAHVLSADPNPSGPGIIENPLPGADIVCVAAPKAEEVHKGSYAVADVQGRLPKLSSFTLVATVLPTRLMPAWRAVIQLNGPEGRQVARLGISNRGAPHLHFPGTNFASPAHLQLHHWYRIWATYDQAAGRLEVGSVPLEEGQPVGKPTVAWAKASDDETLTGGQLLFGASREDADPFRFSGRIERPMIFGRALSAEEIEAAHRNEAVTGLVAAWDFSIGHDSDRITDTGPHGLHGRLVNCPVRAVAGSSWTGEEMCFRHAPGQYGAIHFHDDDIDDCRWPACYEWTVPERTPSGAYALHLEAGGLKENVPFFVVPPKGKASARIAVLISTFTYVIYANHARPDYTDTPGWADRWHARTKAWGGYAGNPAAIRDYGLSTYNFHSDGSGISISTWHRPILNLRVGYITYPDPMHGSGLRHFPADTHLIAWLESQDYSYDLITDWELHHEGAELLQRYAVVMTGSHPEYHTPEMLDALKAYRNGGGKLMYLGGNGFYWRVALAKFKDGLIEIRRGEGGLRAWAAEPGEYYNQFDGGYGGLWRRNGRPPQKLVGVGFTAQGQFVGQPYRKTQAARDPKLAWMFEGIEGDTFGAHGLSGNGAAGFELDRADARLGTPANAVVVARSENHPREHWILTHEEQLTHITTLPGGPPERHIHADMVYFETKGGGAVFSAGSITYCGSLPTNDFKNDISRLTANVLDRFLAASGA